MIPKEQSIRICNIGIPRIGPAMNASGNIARQAMMPQSMIHLLRTRSFWGGCGIHVTGLERAVKLVNLMSSSDQFK